LHQVFLDLLEQTVVRAVPFLQCILFFDDGTPEFDGKPLDLSLLRVHVVHIGECDVADLLELVLHMLLLLANEFIKDDHGLLADVLIRVFAEVYDLAEQKVPFVLVFEGTVQKVKPVEDGFQRENHNLRVVVLERACQDAYELIPYTIFKNFLDVAQLDEFFAHLPCRLDTGHANIEVRTLEVIE